MRDQLKQRLKQLQLEFESGQTMLSELQNQQNELQNTMLRIQGAIQVLEEELSKSEKLTLQNNENSAQSDSV